MALRRSQFEVFPPRSLQGGGLRGPAVRAPLFPAEAAAEQRPILHRLPTGILAVSGTSLPLCLPALKADRAIKLIKQADLTWRGILNTRWTGLLIRECPGLLLPPPEDARPPSREQNPASWQNARGRPSISFSLFQKGRHFREGTQ